MIKSAPIGIRCWPVRLSDGSVYVHGKSADRMAQGIVNDGEYHGRIPFGVTRKLSGDIVSVRRVVDEYSQPPSPAPVIYTSYCNFVFFDWEMKEIVSGGQDPTIVSYTRLNSSQYLTGTGFNGPDEGGVFGGAVWTGDDGLAWEAHLVRVYFHKLRGVDDGAVPWVPGDPLHVRPDWDQRRFNGDGGYRVSFDIEENVSGAGWTFSSNFTSGIISVNHNAEVNFCTDGYVSYPSDLYGAADYGSVSCDVLVTADATTDYRFTNLTFS